MNDAPNFGQVSPEPVNPIPKIVWLFWSQGLDQAPAIVGACIQSWKEQNPGWDVRVIDDNNLSHHTALRTDAPWWQLLSLNHRSDLIRLVLLRQHGGVWADATTCCAIPLDQWLSAHMNGGFFVFSSPSRDRSVASWFIACTQGHPLVSSWEQMLHQHLAISAAPDNPPRSLLRAVLSRLLNRDRYRTRWWFHPLVSRGLRVTPYYCVHYMFDELLRKDFVSAEIWRQTSRLPAAPAFALLANGLSQPPSAALRSLIDQRKVPVFKLSWKHGLDAIPAGSCTEYLFTHLADPHAPRKTSVPDRNFNKQHNADKSSSN